MNKRDKAETVALQALGWLAGQEDSLARFFAETGTNAGGLAQQATNPAFLAAVVDFLLTDDQMVIAASTALQIAPEELVQVRASLPGGDLPNWT